MTREQLLALLRDAQEFIYHAETCEIETNWRIGVQCTCGMRKLMVRVEDALATERTETARGMNCGNPDCNYMMLPPICTHCGWVVPASRTNDGGKS